MVIGWGLGHIILPLLYTLPFSLFHAGMPELQKGEQKRTDFYVGTFMTIIHYIWTKSKQKNIFSLIELIEMLFSSEQLLLYQMNNSTIPCP